VTLFKLVRRNLGRNKLRTLLTVGSTAFVLFLMAFMLTALEAIQPRDTDQRSTLRLVTRHATSLTFFLPEAYEARLREIPGVVEVNRQNWFGGIYIDPANFFAQFATDPKTLFPMYPEIGLAEEQKGAFISERTACIVSEKLARRFGWKLGDKIPLKGTIYPVTLSLTVRGIYKRGELDDFPALYFHWEYLDELLGERGIVGTYTSMVAKAEDLARVSEAIDRAFENTDRPTKTEPEKAFLAGFTSMWGDVAGLVRDIGLAAVFTIIMVAANTMAMSLRERVNEVAVLKTLGFRRVAILTLLVGESLAIALTGCLLGAGGAKLLFDAVDLSMFIPFISVFVVSWRTLGICFAVSLLVGLVSGAVPAWRAAQVDIVEGLRKVA
jgi:putative ABC transport system permease protein